MPGSPFRDNVVLLTGASQGIGRETALLLARQGARLVLAARRAGPLETVAAACRDAGAEAVAVPTDVTVPAACEAAVRRALDTYGALDTVIHNAGISQAFPFAELTDLDLPARLLAVNVLGPMYLTHHALPHLVARRGRIVAVASLTARLGVPLRAIYAASKHALAGFLDALRLELADTGVSVTVVYPDFVQTEVRDRVLGPDGRPLAVHPLRGSGAFMTADECARHVVRAAAGRRREAILGARGKAAVRLRGLVPGLIDRLARRAVRRVRFGRAGPGA